MERVSTYVFRVPSDSAADKTYFVDLTPEERSCSCTHFAIQRNRAIRDGQPIPNCKHMDAAVYEMMVLDRNDMDALNAEVERIKATTKLMQTLKDLQP